MKQVEKTFIARTPAEVEQMKQDAIAQGMDPSQLKVIPERYLRRYYAQFRGAGPRSDIAKGYDLLVDLMVTSVVFARIGYIPKNFVQNLIMAAPHQGAWLPVNAVKAAQAWKDPELRYFLRGEVGSSGATATLAREAKTEAVKGKIVHAVVAVADEPVRFAAFIHEAMAEGVISKGPFLTKRDKAALLSLRNPGKLDQLNDIRSRGVEAMADFSRLTPAQSRWARRFFIIPGWLMAGSRYPFHFAATHPIRSALLAYIAMGEPGAPDQLHFNKPIDQYFAKNVPKYLEGIPTPWGTERTGSISPVSTPWDIYQAAKGGSPDTVVNYANPLATGIFHTLNRDVATQEGSYKTDYKTAAQRNLIQRLLPSAGLVHDLTQGSSSKVYEDKGPVGRLRREVGILPIHVNKKEAERRYEATLPTLERHQRKLMLEAKTVGAQVPPAVLDELKWDVKANHELSGQKTWTEKWKIIAKLFDEKNGTDYSHSVKITSGEAQAHEAYSMLRPLLTPQYSAWWHEVDKVYDTRIAAAAG